VNRIKALRQGNLRVDFMEKDKKAKRARAKGASKKYSKPKIKKHKNLKEITLLSFNPPGN
jgi:hypothetical protein